MRILFDNCTPATLRKYFKPHRVTLAVEQGWDGLKNGDLLRQAEQHFDVLISTDSNIQYQQNLANFDLALIVLRGLKNSEPFLVEVIPECLRTLETIQPGEVIYLFTDAAWEAEQRRK